MIKYIFKDENLLTIKNRKQASAQKIGTELEAIAAAGKDHLTPAAVVDRARDKKSPLHKHFEWDDAKAAENYRLDQARSIIRSIHVESVDAESGRARAFLSIKDNEGTSYRPLSSVLASADLQAKVLAAAERDLLAFENRYRSLSDICELIREVRSRIESRRSATAPGHDNHAS